jgi:hypothetical protein
MFAAATARLQGDFARARFFRDASIELWRRLNDPVGLAISLGGSTGDYLVSGEFEKADATAREGLALARTGGEPFALCNALMVLGVTARVRGEQDRAVALMRESIAVAEKR